MTKTRRRWIHILIFTALMAVVGILFWVIFHIEPIGETDYEGCLRADQEDFGC